MTRDTAARILDATFECVAERGLGGTSLEVVAAQAGVSRQTLYRHFGSREGVLEALVLREEQWFIERVVAAAEGEDDLERGVRSAVTAALEAAIDHPLLQRLLESEPGAILPLMVGGAGPVLSEARPVVADIIRERASAPPDVVDEMADMCSRLIVSYVLDPSRVSPDRVAARIAQFVTRMLVDDRDRAPRGA